MDKFKFYFKSAFTVDNVIFGFEEGTLQVLLIKRNIQPALGEWALPGNFVEPTEALDDACVRVLEQLTGVRDVYLEQVKTFGKVDRHPYGRVITVAYYSLVKSSDFELLPASIAIKAKWQPVHEIDRLPFDHNEILKACLEQLKQRVRARPVGFELLPPKFTLTELQNLYEAILDTTLDKRNFRKKIISMNLLVDLNELQEGVAHRPAKLYQFDKGKYEDFLDSGYAFELKESKKKVVK
ncbi:MAG: 8-oxo-dGTP diphosphatase [Paraglaciecola sp.]|jgi:8-oxo-dGTP diphosphatase